MTKKLATLVAMLACCVFGALAQRVATTPVTDVQTGVYMLRMKSDRIPGTDGAWVYYKDSHAWGESDNTALKVVTENPLSEDHYNYLWRVVRKDDGKITIQSFTANTYWAKAKGGQPSLGLKDNNKWVPNDFPMSETENAFTLEQNGNSGYKLKTYSTRTYYSGFSISQKSEEKEVYVVDNVDMSNSDKANAPHNIGYQQTSATRSDITFEFYEVTQFPEKVSFTYNYLYDGESKKTEKFDVYTYKPYPAITVPDFIKANAPEGEIKPEDNGTTINIECTPDLPFTLSTDANRVYYYLVAGAGTEGRTMLYANGKDLKLRAEAQADNLTAMRNDLWYVTGNPYDGLKFHNVGSGTTAMSYLALSDQTKLWLTNSLGGGLDKWKVYRISDKAFGLYNYNNWCGNVAWKLNGSEVSFEKIDANAPNTSDAFAFQAIEPTYVLPLHNSEADNAAFATTCAPFNFAIVGDDVKAYAGKLSADGKELDMKEIEGNVPANQGVILKAAMGVSGVTVKVVNTADAIDNDLKGTNDEMTDLSQVYVFGRDNVTRHVGFFNAAGNAALPANRAYLDKPAQEAVNAVAMNFGNGMVTNINTAISAHGADNAPIYDLSGRRVQRTVKGSLYIKGGRKFMAQ